VTDQPSPPPPSQPPPAAVATSTPPAHQPWYRSTWFTVLSLVVFPVGLTLMWTRRPSWGRHRNSIVTAAVAVAATAAVLVVLAATRTPGSHPPSPSGASAVLTSPGSTSSAPPAATPTTKAATPSPSSAAKPPPTRRAAPGTPAPAPAGFRNPALWPFARTSIWNMPIGSSAVYVTARVAPATQRTVTTDQDVIVMEPSAPMTPILWNGAGWSGGSRCSGQGLVLGRAPIPTSLVVPSSTNNYSFAVLMTDGQTVVQGQPLARCSAGGAATALHLSTPANLYTDGTLGAHGGSGMSSLGGTVRLGELVPGAPPIRHALKVNLDGAADYWPVGFRWPAVKEDSYGPQRYGGKVPALKMGALLALPASLNLASLNLQTAPGKMIAWTLQNYGAYCVDDAARSVFSIATELGPAGAVSTQFQQGWGYPFSSGVKDTPWAKDIATIVANLAVVDNNSPISIGGGGTPRQPYAPPFSALATVAAVTAPGSNTAVPATLAHAAVSLASTAPSPATARPALAPALVARREAATAQAAPGPPAPL
jgi:pyruvate/2-oxoglutarate dehydrogenase complex dihydrolipoamide acyltransferase (E2) component